MSLTKPIPKAAFTSMKNTVIQGEKIDIIQGIVYNCIMKSYKTIWINSEKRQIRLHRYIMEKHLGRKLSSNELVHHINEDRFDNRIENLEIVNRSEHKKLHNEIGESTRIKQKFFFEESELIDLRKKGLSMYKIADIYKCGQPTIFRALRKYGIK